MPNNKKCVGNNALECVFSAKIRLQANNQEDKIMYIYHQSRDIFQDKITLLGLHLPLCIFASWGFTWRRRYTKYPIKDIQVFGSKHFPLLCITMHYDGC